MNKNNLKLIRLGIIIAAVVLILFLLAKDFALSGKLSFKTDFKKFTPFVSLLMPQERVKIFDSAYIEQEPVYFDVYLPRDFAKINLEFTYKNFSNNLIEVGPQIGEYNWDLQPLDNKIINQLTWPKLEKDNLFLFQRDRKFNSIGQFLSDLPPVKEIAAYNYNFDYDYKMDNYQPSEKLLELNKGLDGGYEIFTYIQNEDLYFEFDLASEEIEINSENTNLYVYDNLDNNIAIFPPDNNKIIASLQNLPTDYYKLALSTNNFVQTKSIKTKQQYLSFINGFDLLSPAQLITESNNLTFLATNNAGLQTIKINEKNLEIAEIWQQHNLDLEPGPKEVIIPKGNLQITGEGLFAFSQEQYFNPLFKTLYKTTDLDKENINYVITQYNLPLNKNDFKINNVSFDLHDKDFNNGKLRFIISIPGLSSSAQGVLLENLKITLSRKPIWQESLITNFKKYLRYYENEIK
ncbi:MAG: hypothetical protein GF365_05280 [Candidatus Buchananbacteria bacterium]|nr:hypothetical protein [Candidatus Buchananbacteria bacterium]